MKTKYLFTFFEYLPCGRICLKHFICCSSLDLIITLRSCCYLVIIGDWNAKVRSQEIPGVTGKFGLGVQNEVGQRLTEFCQQNALVLAHTLFQQRKRRLCTWTSQDGQYRNPKLIILFAAKDGEALYNQQK